MLDHMAIPARKGVDTGILMQYLQPIVEATIP
jgi:hypothetical protein